MDHESVLLFAPKADREKHHTNHTIDNGVIAVDKASRCMPTFCSALDIISKIHSCTTLQKHYRKQHVCDTAQMVNSAITAMRDEASTTTNKWLTLKAWKTILYHYYDLDDELGFSVNAFTRAVKLFGSIVESKVSAGNSTGVHFRTQYFIK